MRSSEDQSLVVDFGVGVANTLVAGCKMVANVGV